MAQIKVTPSKTYATERNLHTTVADCYGFDHLRYLVAWTQEGRCYPIFVGSDAIEVAHHGFIVVS